MPRSCPAFVAGANAVLVSFNSSEPAILISIWSSVLAWMLVSASASRISSVPFISRLVAMVAAVMVGEPARLPSILAIKVCLVKPVPLLLTVDVGSA